MHKIKRLALMLALLVPFVAGPVYADSAPPPEPVVPLTTILEGGKVIVNIGSPRNADHAIGASVPIILVFELQHLKGGDVKPDAKADKSPKATEPAAPVPFDPAAFLADTAQAPTAPAAKPLPVPRVNIEGLQMGVISALPSDFGILGTPEVQEYTDGDKDYVRVIFWVWQFVTTQKNADGTPKRQASLQPDFLYAVDTLPDGQPDWKKASTKELLIDIVPSAGDEQTAPREGDLQTKQSTHAAVIPYLTAFGIALMLPLFGLLGWNSYTAYVRPRKLTANEIFWLEVDQVVSQAEAKGGFELDDYQKILFELRRRYDVSTMYTEALLKHLEAEANFPTLERVFGLEEKFFVKDGTVTTEQHDELMSSLKLLIPRT